MDEVTKRREYATGMPQYRVVDRDDAQTVTRYQLSAGTAHAERAKMPLARAAPDHLGDHLA